MYPHVAKLSVIPYIYTCRPVEKICRLLTTEHFENHSDSVSRAASGCISTTASHFSSILGGSPSKPTHKCIDASGGTQRTRGDFLFRDGEIGPLTCSNDYFDCWPQAWKWQEVCARLGIPPADGTIWLQVGACKWDGETRALQMGGSRHQFLLPTNIVREVMFCCKVWCTKLWWLLVNTAYVTWSKTQI